METETEEDSLNYPSFSTSDNNGFPLPRYKLVDNKYWI